ncbi:hypothetical protein ATI61_122110 [Archangium gephyra]|uniref:Uncharacterized protein n=1 Tax=Archangium gephyra TaxID=48 RepID=A0AAC8Q0B3_9BACT|nr:hypothetical protein [Archangium gephyra]AKI98491.1 Hypothetical protein AA314_00118 [Archangium gephyra]REG20410.1 hypothetical protein ATI61_122110 [Archangium gephyra]
MFPLRADARQARRGVSPGVVWALALVLWMVPMTARAAPESARLLPAGLMTDNPVKWTALELGTGAGAAVVAVPATLALSAWVGSLSSDLVLAAAPAMVLLLVVPPLAVTGAQWLVGNALQPGSVRFQPAVWVALGVHVLAVTGAVLLGATVDDLGDAALFTLVEALVLPTAVTLTMRATAPVPPPTLSRVPERPRSLVEATASRALVVPLLRYTF